MQTVKTPKKGNPKRTKSVFQTIFVALIAVLLVETVLLATALTGIRVPQQLNQNAEDILNKQISNRQSYLEKFLLDAQDLSTVSEQINNTTLSMLQSGKISYRYLDSDSDRSYPLLQAVSDHLVQQLRLKSVTGIFVVINTHSLDDREDGDRLPGIYIRDMDPDAPISERNGDLSYIFAPTKLVQSTKIYTDVCWQPTLEYTKESCDFLYQPFQRAWSGRDRLDAQDYGRWTTQSFRIQGDSQDVITYTQPLILPDGRIYGVVGVELMVSYLQKQLPYPELENNGTAAYVLAVSDSKKPQTNVTLTEVVGAAKNTELPYEKSFAANSGKPLMLEDETSYSYAAPLTLYSQNAPFSNEQWYLVGTVPTGELFEFSANVQSILTLTVLLTFAVGSIFTFLVSRRLATPIADLSAQVSAARKSGSTIPQLPPTGIQELDQFSSEFAQLSQDVLDTSTKFLRIMNMASVELGGYEKRPDSETVYVTDNFFPMLGMPQIGNQPLTNKQFDSILETLLLRAETFESGRVITVPRADGSLRYILLRSASENDVQVGLVEDVTASLVERRRIEHERDYDVLTGLLNRRAFWRKCNALFAIPNILEHAAFVMMDLDNLKHINDSYGHDWGDRYLQLAGQCLTENTPHNNTICARLSGDEFLVFLYGFETAGGLDLALEKLHLAFSRYTMLFPDGASMEVQTSIGVSRYPEDSTDVQELRKYADFAMYQVKRGHKNDMRTFDVGAYNRDIYDAQQRKEFHQMLAEGAVTYHFQPLFSSADGTPKAYEALMRVQMSALRSPAAVMKLARETDRLYEVEQLTFSKACESYQRLRFQNRVDHNAKLFINSIANVHLTDEDFREIMDVNSNLMPQLVVEITEEEELNLEVLEHKRRQLGGVGSFALDDYGSGYSNSNTLLVLAPDYIKVDLTIIRDIDKDPDKQQLVVDIVQYAHDRGRQVVAEGIETPEELRCVIDLGVDLLQGYYLAKPAVIPPAIAPEAKLVIDAMHQSKISRSNS